MREPREGGDTRGCLELETARALVQGSLPPGDIAYFNAHAEACPRCHRLVVGLARDEVSRGTSLLDEAEPHLEEVALPKGGGLVFGRYLVLDTLGAGGMGAVYLARDTLLRREVALKLARRTGEASAETIRKEAQAIAAIRDPHVVTVYDLAVGDEVVAIAMELVRGETLREHLARRPRREVLPLLEQMARGLAAAHAAGVVHGDVKLDNALVAVEGRRSVVRLTDFGLARLDGAAAHGMPRGGTPRYAAPELLRGEAATPRSDQYALAASWVEALAGAAPGWRERLDRVPRALRPALARALAPEPEARFPSVEAMLATSRRHRLLRRSAAAVLAAVLAVGVPLLSAEASRRAEESCLAEYVASLPVAPQRTPTLVETGHGEPAGEAAWAEVRVAHASWVGRWSRAAGPLCRGEARSGLARCLEVERERVALALARSRIDALSSSAAVHELEVALRGRAEGFRCDDPELLPLFEAMPDAKTLATMQDVLARDTAMPMPELDALVLRLEALGRSEALAHAYQHRGVVHWHARRMAAAEADLRRALHLAQDLREREMEGFAWLQLASLVTYRGGRLEEGEFYLRNARAVIATLDAPALAQWYRDLEADIALTRGRPDRAWDVIARTWTDALPLTRPPVHAMALSGLALLELGRHAEARTIFARQLAERRARHGNDHTRVAGALHNLGLALAGLGEDEAARTALREARDIRMRVLGRDDPELALVERSLAHFELVRGDLGSHAALMAAVGRLRAAVGAQAVEWFRSGVILAEGHLMTGRLEDADREASDALVAAVEHGYDAGRYPAQAMLVRAAVALERGELRSARALIEQARALPGEPLAHEDVARSLARLEAMAAP